MNKNTYTLDYCNNLRVVIADCKQMVATINADHFQQTGESQIMAPTSEFLDVAGNVLDGFVVALEDSVVTAVFQEYVRELEIQLDTMYTNLKNILANKNQIGQP